MTGPGGESAVGPAPATGYAPGPADAIDFTRVRRVLVTKLRHHGDVLLTTPVFTALRAALPRVDIDALVYRETLPLIEHNPDLAAVHVIDRAWKNAGPLAQLAAEWRLFAALRARRYDLIIHLTEHQRGATLARLLRPRWAVAPERRGLAGLARRWWQGAFTHFTRSVASGGPGSRLPFRHTVEFNLDALRRLGLAVPAPPGLTLVPGGQGEAAAAALRAQAGLQTDAYLLMQPTSRWFFKTWPVQRNAELLVQLLARGETVLLSAAPDAREQAMVAAIVAAVGGLQGLPAGQMPRGLVLAQPRQSLAELAALIRDARLFIGIDSAPMHMAAAMGTPVVALFGPSSELAWGPWQVPHRSIVSDAHPCRPCGQDGCGGGKISACIETLPVARVLAALDELAAEAAARGAVRVQASFAAQ